MEVKPKPSFEFKQNMKNVTKMAPERKGGSIEWLIGQSQNDNEVSFTQKALMQISLANSSLAFRGPSVFIM